MATSWRRTLITLVSCWGATSVYSNAATRIFSGLAPQKKETLRRLPLVCPTPKKTLAKQNFRNLSTADLKMDCPCTGEGWKPVLLTHRPNLVMVTWPECRLYDFFGAGEARDFSKLLVSWPVAGQKGLRQEAKTPARTARAPLRIGLLAEKGPLRSEGGEASPAAHPRSVLVCGRTHGQH